DAAEHPLGGGDDPSGVLVGQARVVAEDGGDVVDVDLALPQGLPGVQGLHQRDLGAVADQEVGDAVQQFTAFTRGHGPPGAAVEGGACGGDGVVHVRGGGLTHHGQHTGVVGVGDLAHASVGGGPPGSADVQPD